MRLSKIPLTTHSIRWKFETGKDRYRTEVVVDQLNLMFSMLYLEVLIIYAFALSKAGC